jgi:excinuclease ABC subunit B
LRNLRKGQFDVLVGVNLLREGLDLPEVALVAILDADKEGFLRSTRSLIQTFGRAARNVNGKVIMYADTITASMQKAIEETNRRRQIQQTYNQQNKITPETIRKEITSIFDFEEEPSKDESHMVAEATARYQTLEEVDADIRHLENEMRAAAKSLEFERAAELRDKIKALQKLVVLESL